MNEEVRILKIATCKSLSGRTRITYHVGCSDAKDVCFRIWDTSGKGVFSKEWVSASEIQKVLKQQDLLSAPSMLPVFKIGRSVNTAGYLLAVLKEEGLVELSADKPHKYVRVQSDTFVAEVAELIKKGVQLDPLADGPERQRAGRKKAPAAAPWIADAHSAPASSD